MFSLIRAVLISQVHSLPKNVLPDEIKEIQDNVSSRLNLFISGLPFQLLESGDKIHSYLKPLIS
jgi:hypothetical protein